MFGFNGKLTTNLEISDIISSIEHNHERDEGSVEVAKLHTALYQRKRKEGRSKDSGLLMDLKISGEWTRARGHKPVPFLIYDSGTEANNRIIMLATKEAMHNLAKADIWCMDGTFTSTPALLEQLFVFRAPLGDSAISCVYAFLSGKIF